jgi:hypothetical protein
VPVAGPGLRWDEIVEPREMFGGPDIIGVGGVAAGPHGDFVAGTWTDARSHPVVAVWRSPDGRTWSRDSTDPSFVGRSGEVPFGTAVADGPHGVLVTGTAEVPTRSDPTGQRGALWYSPDGVRCRRILSGAIAAPREHSTFAAVTATGSGWLIAGTEGTGPTTRATVWTLDSDLRRVRATPLPPSTGPVTVTAMTPDRDRVLVAGLAGTILSVLGPRASTVWATTWH